MKKAIWGATVLFLIICIFLPTHRAEAAGEFVTTWKTDNSGVSTDHQITIPTTTDYVYDYTVDWGDSSSDTHVTGNITHTYASIGTYTVKISGTFPAIRFLTGGDKDKLLSVTEWGTIEWQSMSSAFFGCSNLQILATDVPDLSSVIDFTFMFRGSGVTNPDFSAWDVSNVIITIGMFQDTSFNGDISTWDVSNMTRMDAMFYNDTAFNGDITSWNPESATHMGSMFAYNTVFNRDIGSWNVGSATDMSSMFYHATSFNQNLSAWDVSNVTNMNSMFEGASAFNGTLAWGALTASVTNMQGMFSGATVFNRDIGGWDTSSVTNMGFMFANAKDFNQNINSWNVSNVTDFGSMFYEADDFNQPLGDWDTGSATGMGAMFTGVENFDQDLSGWDTSDVEYMGNMFQGTAFNHDISGWDVGNVTGMYAMFAHNSVFNQDLGAWDTSSVESFDSMFYFATAFDQDISGWNVESVQNMTDMLAGVTLSTRNYDALLEMWSQQNLQLNVTLDAGNSTYCATALRANIEGMYGWTIIDGGEDADCPEPVTTPAAAPGAVGVVPVNPFANDADLKLDFTINGGVPTSRSRTVKIEMNTDPKKVSGYAISLDPKLSDTGIRPYVSTTLFELPAEKHAYTLYVKFFSTTGHSSDTISHLITYDPMALALQASPFLRSLKLGDSGNDVLQLQKLLNELGFAVTPAGPGSKGRETKYFGPATAKALAIYQKVNGIKPASGFFGPVTRAYVVTH